MSEAQTKAKTTKTADKRDAAWSPELSPELPARQKVKPRLRIIPVLITLVTVAFAVPLGWAMWDAYMGAPWTRDGTVRVYVVTMAPEVAGRIVNFPVADNQFVHKGDLLMVIDPRDYTIAVSRAEAAVKQSRGRCAERGDTVTAPAKAGSECGHYRGPADLCDDGGCRPSASISKPWQIWTRRGSTSSALRSTLLSMAG